MDLGDLRRIGKDLDRLKGLHPPKPIKIPVQLNCEIPPASWKLRNDKLVQTVTLVDEGCARPTDAWVLRREFLSLSHDPDAMLSFVRKYGMWAQSAPTDFDDYWEFRDELRDMMRNRNYFLLKKHSMKRLTRRVCDVEWNHGVPVLVVEVSCCEDALISSVEVDLLRGVKFSICARKDCQQPFEARPRYRKQFCDQKCAHLVSVRRTRKERKKRSAGRKP